MFPQKELKRLARKKQTIIARSDLLRAECSEMWSALDHRKKWAERYFGGMRWLSPALSLLSTGATFYLKSRRGRGNRFLAPLFSLAAAAMREQRQPLREDPKAYRLPES